MTQARGEPGEPTTSADAARLLAEITPVARRARRLARDTSLARPLLAWGLAWTTGAVVFQYVPGPGGVVLGSAPAAGAAAVTWLARSRDVRLPARRRLTRAWLAFTACSPLLIAVAQPANARLLTVFLASLWGVAMVLYGIATEDVPLSAVGSAIVIAAAVARLAVPAAALLTVGACGGLGMTALGAWRLRWKS